MALKAGFAKPGALTKPAVIRLDDPAAERARDSHAAAIEELQSLPAAQLTIVGEFVVPDGGSVLVNHGLGRKPRMVILSPPRVEFGTPGLVAGGLGPIDLPGPTVDRTQQLRIFATGFGVPLTVVVAVL
jgi:hypothetical protein